MDRSIGFSFVFVRSRKGPTFISVEQSRARAPCNITKARIAILVDVGFAHIVSNKNLKFFEDITY